MLRNVLERILTRMGGEVRIAGLEVSDSALRFAFFEAGQWQLTSVRLAPGVLDAGQVKDAPAFRAAVASLRTELESGGKKHKKKIGVVISLSSLNVYSHVFSLPLVSEKQLEEAIQLNLQMLAPSEFGVLYAGSQVLGTDALREKVEVLGAYGNRAAVDAIQEAVVAAGFLVVAVEFRGLSLARVIRERSLELDMQKSYVVFNVDDMGLDFLILREGRLSFEYYVPWRDIHKGRYLPFAEFENVIVSHLYRVLNFYNQRWSGLPLAAVLLAAIGLRPEIEKVVRDNFSLAVRDIPLRVDPPVGIEWFSAIGAGLRGIGRRSEDTELSLSGIEVQERFRREQILAFGSFWRVLVPAVIGLLILLSFTVDFFVGRIEQALVAETPHLSEEIIKLEEEAQQFNILVTFLTDKRRSFNPLSPVLQKLLTFTKEHSVTLTHLAFAGFEAPMELKGEGSTKDAILAFKKALEGERASFRAIDLPFSAIQCSGGTCSFSMSFSIIAATSSKTN